MTPPSMARCISLVAGAALTAGFIAAVAFEAGAQPEPSFQATCGDLRAAIRKLDPKEESLVTIQVVGALTSAQTDGALAYLTMCSAPDPQVLCITYSTNGRQAGETAVLSGTYGARGPDHILLDPCLHFVPEQTGRR